MPPTLFLSASDPTLMYQQVIDQIVAKVLAGDWPPGTALPSIRELASESSISVITVKRAYQELERDGVIVTRQGKGSFVSESIEAPRALLLAELESHLSDAMRCAGRLGLTRKALHELLDAAAASPDNPVEGSAT